MIFFTHSCTTTSQTHSRTPDSTTKEEDLVSVPTVIELARTAYHAGCVRSFIKKGTKGKFEYCRKEADQYVNEEVIAILKSNPEKTKK